MRLVLEQDRYVLKDTTFALREVPKAAKFRWDPETKTWFTNDEDKARQLAQYAQNGLREQWGLAPADGGSEPEPTNGPVIGTPQQDAFWNEIVNGTSHITLMARAGCGKSFSIIEAAKRALAANPSLKIGFAAYNSHIAKELTSKVPNACSAITMHVLGKRAVERWVGHSLNPDDSKLANILSDLAGYDDRNERGKVDRALSKICFALVSLCKSYLMTGTPEELDALVERHDIDFVTAAAPTAKFKPKFDATELKARTYELVPLMLNACKENVSTIDFDDMVWLPVVLGLPVENFDILMVDEAQDLNKCRQQLALAACPTGRVVIVGDPAQAIYGFQGADTQSMATLTEMLDNTERRCTTLPLTFTRRCPHTHIAQAQKLVPDIEALPEAAQGSIEHILAPFLSKSAQAGDMILCRTNAPLVAACHQFLRANRKAVIRGKDQSGPIRDLIDGLAAESIDELGDMLSRYRSTELARLEKAGKSVTLISLIEDRCDTVEVLIEGCRTLDELQTKMSRIFDNSDESNAIILSSVHSAKGLEADTVFILRPDIMPHPNAKREEDLEQERNIKYVALTRSKNRLVFVHEDDPKMKAEMVMVGGTVSNQPAAQPVSRPTGEPCSEARSTYWREDVDALLRQALTKTAPGATKTLEALKAALHTLHV